jgi:hypothetical protein
VINVIAMLAALAALLTSLAMLKDTHLGPDEHAEFRRILRDAVLAFRAFGWQAVERHELARVVRFFLRAGVLIAIAASSGVSLLLPHQLDLYSAVLRCSLVAFLAMQAPCPWLHWIAKGDRRGGRDSIDQGASESVQR